MITTQTPGGASLARGYSLPALRAYHSDNHAGTAEPFRVARPEAVGLSMTNRGKCLIEIERSCPEVRFGRCNMLSVVVGA